MVGADGNLSGGWIVFLTEATDASSIQYPNRRHEALAFANGCGKCGWRTACAAVKRGYEDYESLHRLSHCVYCHFLKRPTTHDAVVGREVGWRKLATW